MSRFHLSLVTACLAGLLLQTTFAAEKGVQLSNSHLRVVLADDGSRILELTELPSGFNLLDGKGAHHLWSIAMADGAEQLDIQPGMAKSFRAEPLRETAPAMRLTWEDFHLAGAPGLKVVGTVRLDPDTSISRWRISIENSAKLRVGKVRYPIISGIRERKDEQLAVPAC